MTDVERAMCAEFALSVSNSRNLGRQLRKSRQARFFIPVHLAFQDPLVRRVEAFVKANVGDHIGLDDIARAMAVAPRTLNRRITDATGMPPMKFVQKIRLDMALHKLKTTRKSLHLVAEDVGFAEPSALYRLIVRHTGQTPSSLRNLGNSR